MRQLTHKRLKQIKEAAEADRGECKDTGLNKSYTVLIAACHHLDSVLPADPPEVVIKKEISRAEMLDRKNTGHESTTFPPKPKKPEVMNDEEKYPEF